MSRVRIAAIVEGHGEMEAVPVLLRRYTQSMGLAGRIDVDPVIRQSASKLCSKNELERVVEYAIQKMGGSGGILILLDSDGKCPAKLGPSLLGRVRQASRELPVSVVVAHHEFEAWFPGQVAALYEFGG